VSSYGIWGHIVKIGFEKYFMRKIRKAISESFYERMILKFMGAVR
jgi:sulfide:quinone oxidoreductase